MSIDVNTNERMPESFYVGIQRDYLPESIFSSVANDIVAFGLAERAFVLVRKGRSFRVAGASGFGGNPKSQPLLRKLSKAVRAIGVIPGRIKYVRPDSDELTNEAPSIVDYLLESAAKEIGFLSISPLSLNENGPELKSDFANVVVVIESFEPNGFSTEQREAMARFQFGLNRILSNAFELQSLPFFKLSTLIRTQFRIFFQRRYRVRWYLGILIAMIFSASMFIPVRHRVGAQGVLQRAIHRDLFAPRDAEVVKILVRDGQEVLAGDVLLQLQSKDLETQQAMLVASISERKEIVRSLSSRLSRFDPLGQRDDLIKMQGEIATTEIEITGLKNKLTLLESQAQSLTIRSPISGVVAGFDIENQLNFRPVDRGAKLLTVFDPSSPWELKLDVPENRVGHLIHAKGAQNTEPLRVSFRMATEIATVFDAQFAQLAKRADVSQEHGMTVQATAIVQSQMPDSSKPGNEVYARIVCENQPLWYVMFEDVVDFLFRYVVP